MKKYHKKTLKYSAPQIFWVSFKKNPCSVVEKACGVKFFKHGGAVNFLRVVGVDPPTKNA